MIRSLGTGSGIAFFREHPCKHYSGVVASAAGVAADAPGAFIWERPVWAMLTQGPAWLSHLRDHHRERPMPRAFEMRRQEGAGDADASIAVRKICRTGMEKEPGNTSENITTRSVAGHEPRAIVPPHAAEEFLRAYRTYLQEGDRRGG